MDRRLQPFGLSEATWLPLIYVARAPAPMRQKDLAIGLTLNGSLVARLLDVLETSGFIERRENRPHPSPRRSGGQGGTAQPRVPTFAGVTSEELRTLDISHLSSLRTPHLKSRSPPSLL